MGGDCPAEGDFPTVEAFTRIPATLRRRIGRLTEFTLEDLAQALLDFKDISDAEAWVAARKSV
jgi:hypothetical protein